MDGIQTDAKMRKQVYVAKLKALQEDYQTFKVHHAELQEKIQPRRGRNLAQSNEKKNQGQKRNQDIIDSTARLALRSLRSGMMAGFSSPMTPWFRTSCWDPQLTAWGKAKSWLHKADELVYQVLERANAYNTFGYCYENLGLHGVGAFGRYASRDTVVYFDPYAVGTFWFGVDRQGKANSFYHLTEMTAPQLVREFGKERVSPKVITELYDKHDAVTTVPILWVVEENDELLPNEGKGKNRKYRSVRFELNDEETDLLLEEGGFHEFPICVPRWDTEGTDSWGRSCGMDALPDVNSSYKLHEDKYRTLAYRTTPPVGAPKELEKRPSSLLPGHITFYDTAAGVGKVEPLWEVNASIDDIREEIREHNLRIDRAFYADLWQTLAAMEARGDGRQRTATEVAMLHQEKLLMLAPTLFRLVDEMHRPTILGIIQRAIRAGILEPPPQELVEAGLKVDFISILAEAHDLVRAGSIERVTEFAGGVMQLSPQSGDLIDWDGVVRKYSDLNNAPEGTMRTDKAVRELRAERAKEVAAQQAMQAIDTAAPAMKSLSETEMDKGSALDQLLAGGTPPGTPGVAG